MKKLVIYLFAGLLFAGCVRNNPDPSWLEVNEWTLLSNPSLIDSQGELNHSITDAWVFIDNRFIGVFEVPFKIPLLESGTNMEITLYPTIRNNGISATKKIYPFYEPLIIQGDLVQNQTLTINPTTYYRDNCDITLWEFEDDANDGIEETVNSPATLFVDNDPAILGPYNGGGFGQVNFDATNNRWQATTAGLMTDIPQQGAEVYMEIDYYNTLDIVTGVVAHNNSTASGNVNVQINDQDPSTIQWKKIYCDLKTIVSGSIDANGFQLSFDALLPDSLSSAQINIDNIKLVHF